jgi:hypothetical protein
LEADINKLIGGDLAKDLASPTGRYNQRGAGRYTLCQQCNNLTGDWYARSYVYFVRQLFWLSHTVGPHTTVSIDCLIRPLDVLKQILVMFCSASPPSFALKHPQLVRFLLNKDARDFEDLRIYMSLYDLENSKVSRQAGLTGRLDGDGKSQIFSEIAFPPFNLVLSVNSGSPDPRLFEITWFKQFAFRQKATVKLTLNNLAVNSYFPGDYRTLDDLKISSRREV